MPRGQRARELERLRGLAQHVPCVVVATGRLIGEGFDHPSLDTLVLAMPISWKGTLQQYAGRLHRRHASKTNICIFDYVDDGVPALARMWGRRQRGYLAMGYEIGAPTYSEGIVSEELSLST
jgi:superfamily II DNA or RNA helicase